MWDRMQLDWRTNAPPGRGPTAEWLVTNGIGGFASGTTLGLHTRRYHGWLVASLQPPVKRTLLWAKSEEQLVFSDGRWPLSTNDYGDTFHPDGWKRLYAFRVYPFPTTVFLANGIMLQRTIFMVRGQNTTAVIYRLLAGPAGVELRLEPLINFRDYHHTVRVNNWPFRQDPWEYGVEVTAYPGAPPLILAAGFAGSSEVVGVQGENHPFGAVAAPRTHGPAASVSMRGPNGADGTPSVRYEPHGMWFNRFHYAVERERGLDYIEDHFRPGTFRWTLGGPGDVAVVVGHCPVPTARHEPPWSDGPYALTAWVLEQFHLAVARRQRIVEQGAPGPGRLTISRADLASHTVDPDWLRLVLAADDFVVRRETTGAATIIAGYPWFTDWGRDAMISLPGLLLHTGRYDTAREVLLTFANHRADGLIPNRFPDDGDEPVYNTVDASLWYVYAVWEYWRATRDEATVKDELFPVIVDIVTSYIRGTRHGIGIDQDGLVRAAAPGLQLTWMDAKAGDWVVTPREGAPVEINALWYNALRSVVQLARLWAPERSGEWERTAADVGRAFRRRFIRPDGALYDVVQPRCRPYGDNEGPDRDDRDRDRLPVDASMRANQIFAASLPFPVLSGGEARRVVRHVTAELLTPVGLRTLSSADPAYKGSYGGDQRSRDAAYHQGTVWPWLLGPFVTARRKTGLAGGGESQTDQAAPGGAVVDVSLLDPLRMHLRHEAALGHVSEIFDGDVPHPPRGCFAQAWSVAEWLRAWSEEVEARHDAGTRNYAHGSHYGGS